MEVEIEREGNGGRDREKGKGKRGRGWTRKTEEGRQREEDNVKEKI
jgi:hypothetical protein